VGWECKHPVQEIVKKSSRKQCILLSIEFFLARHATYHLFCLNQLALERSLEKGMHVGVCMRRIFKYFSFIFFHFHPSTLLHPQLPQGVRTVTVD